MRKNYTLGILFLVLAFMSLSIYGQIPPPLGGPITANNDSFAVQSGTTTTSVLTNDLLDGLALNPNLCTLTLVSASQGLTLNPEGTITLSADTFSGVTYYLNYEICEIANPGNCDTAFVQIFVNDQPLEVILNGVYLDFNNDGFTNVGDVINFQITFTNVGLNVVPSITFCDFDNISVTGGPITNLEAGASDNTTFTGHYVLTQSDINNGSVTSSAYFCLIIGSTFITGTTTTILNNSNGIKLNAFIDLNNNGVQESNEQNFQYGNFNYTVNGGVTNNAYSNNGIKYLYESNPATTYNLGLTIPSQFSNYACSTSYSNVTVATGSGITTYNFPITVVPNKDAAVYIYPYSVFPRPGFQYSDIIVLTNYGTQTIASGTVTYTKDNAVSITSISPNTSVATSSTGFTYNFTNLLPNQIKYIIVNMQVPTIPTVSLGQLVTNTVLVTAPVGDINLLNNNASLTQTIVGSYDPNDKTESHSGKILHSSFTANDYLNYTIRFENTGTAEAINIKVEDVLDSKLDENSIRMVASSHPYVLDRVGSNLKWNFNGVNLPLSVPNTQTGHGYIVFQVKPKPGFAIGDVIPNTANIYFDFNPAIVTNTCTTEFVSTLSNENFTFNNFKSFPNPVKNSLTISNASPIETIEISSILGQKMISKKVNDIQTEIDLSQLSNGIYFVKVTSQGNEKTIKIVKE